MSDGATRVALDGAAAAEAPPGDRDHRRALVEARDVAAQVPRDEAGPARDVEGPAGFEAGHGGEHGLDLCRPAGALATGEDAASQPPVVVLRRALLVVRAHPVVDDAPPGHA